ncbi:MAG TPA: TonB-dependent receptor [Kofleriaceae bacterium]|nr:TonB-dependent receptor [Kofleriaceae bacterium]
MESTPNLSDEELKKLSEQESKEEVITITGSAIERRDLTTPAPVAILKKEQLEQAGLATVGDILQKLPAQSNAINAQANNGGDGSTRVNIRGLGTNRTLTLINGRRVVSSGTGADASVDINTIPLAMFDRIEVLKDGASAIYGSDAVGGVVNVITRTDFNGTEVALYTGGSQKGDGFAFDGSFVTGLSGDKGHVLFAAGYQDQEPVFAGERGFSTIDKNFNFATREESPGGSSAIPTGRLDTTAVTTANGQPYQLCGTTTNAMGMTVPVRYCTFDQSAGAWRPFMNPSDFYNYQPVNYLYTPSSRYNVAATGSYDMSKNTHAFFEGNYMNRSSNQQLAPEPLFTNQAGPNGVVISKDSIYNNLGVDIPVYNRRLVEFGPRASFQNVDSFRLVSGLNGAISEELIPALKNWKWELSYNFGRTNSIQRNEGNLIVGRLQNALGPSFIDGNGNPTCGTPTAPIAGCVPMNILGGGVNDPFHSTNTTGSITADTPGAIGYTTFTGVSTGFNQEHSALATAHGRIAETPWGGDVGLALGADYRKESGGFTPDPLTATGDTTGNAALPTGGSYNVVEGFAELSAVPVAHRGWVEWVELDLAARAFRYNTFGSGMTWKAGGLFRTLHGLALRGTYSTAFRAPSIPELYTGNADNFPASEDPCDTTPPSAGDNTLVLPKVVADRCAAQGVPADASFATAQQRSIVGGNPKLKQETAKVFTAGIVVAPPEVKGLALTLDYFHIQIDQALQALGATAILGNCYYFGLQQYCDAIHRTDNTHEIDFIDDPLRNVGGNKTSGLDFSLSYDHVYPGVGRLYHSIEGTYLRSYEVDVDGRVINGLGVYDLGVYPKLKANFNTTWANGPVGAGFNIRYIHSYRECVNNNCDVEALRMDLTGQDRTVDANVTADVFASYSMKSKAGTTTLAVGVNNVTNQNPPLIYIGFAGDSDSATYNYMGRFFYARLAQRF